MSTRSTIHPAGIPPRGVAPWGIAFALLLPATWRLGLEVGNVFGTRYASFGTFNIHQQADGLERFLTPGAPRTVRLSLERRFGGH